MDKSEIASINSYALDPSIEEFTKQDLTDAGVVIDYDHLNEENLENNKDNKKRPKNWLKWLRWIFLGFLIICVVLIIKIGNYMIERESTVILLPYMENVISYIDYDLT